MKDHYPAKAEMDNSGTQRQADLMTESALETSEKKTVYSLTCLSHGHPQVYTDRKAPEDVRGHKLYSAPTQHPSVCVPAESVSGRWCIHGLSSSAWPERVLMSPTFNTHMTTDKEAVHRICQGCAVKTEKCLLKTPEPEMIEEPNPCTPSDTLPGTWR